MGRYGLPAWLIMGMENEMTSYLFFEIILMLVLGFVAGRLISRGALTCDNRFVAVGVLVVIAVFMLTAFVL